MTIAATKMDSSTDVNSGNVSRKLLAWLAKQPGYGIAIGHRVEDLNKTVFGWDLKIKNMVSRETRSNRAKFVSVGVGGGSLPLLQLA